MSLGILVNGENYNGYISANVTVKFLEASGCASVTLPPRAVTLGIYPIRVQDEVSIKINDKTVLTGYVDKLSQAISSDNHVISVSVRDKTQDLIDSTLSSEITNSISAPISLKNVCSIIVNALGISMNIVDKSGTKDFTSGDIITPKISESAFEFLERYARKRQVLIRSDGEGNLVLERGSSEPYNTILDINSPENGYIKSTKTDIDFTHRYRKYILSSQMSASSIDFSGYDSAIKALTNDVTDIKATATDTQIRKSRQYCFVPKTSYDKESAQDRVKWEANIRRAQSLVYSVVVQGYSPLDDIGKIWDVNKLILINDKYNDISEQKLIDSVSYNVDLDGGETTALTLVSADAYTLQAEKDRRTKSTDQESGDFSFYDK